MTLSLTGANSSKQMHINREVGRIGEKIAKDDYRENGYHIFETKSGVGFDFIAMKFLDGWKLDIIFVEVKVGDSQLSKRQTWFKRWCSKAGQRFDVYHVSKEHLSYKIENKFVGGDL